MVAALAASEAVHINVDDAGMEQSARALLDRAGARGEIVFHHFPTNDAWCRDHGAIFVTRTADHTPLAAVDWQYNAWGGKYPPFDLDNDIPRRMANFLGVPRFDGGMVLEGGSIDVNGRGLLLTTQACLLNPNRNPHLGRGQIETRLRDVLGVEDILWLEDGIVGDDTDGHIDDIARFVVPDVIVAAVEDDPGDDNYDVLRRNRETLRSLARQYQLDVVPLPMPPPVVHEGQRLPASYANFYIANRVVLLPGYDARRDQRAARVLEQLLPGREIVILDCTDLVWGLGAFHCLTQQVPEAG
jgi:agmatine deiminase